MSCTPDFSEHLLTDDKPHEECGVFGLISRNGETDTAHEVYNALFALQHRGQHSAGIAVSDSEKLLYRKGDGLVGEVFSESQLAELTGTMAIGHVRYASQLGTSGVNAQPIIIHHKHRNMALAFNGSLTNAATLKTEIESGGGIFQTTGDAEVILYVIVREMLKTGSMEEALLHAMSILQGAFSILLLTTDKLYAMRDPQGFRPLCLGRLGESFAVSSESCALDAIGAAVTRDVYPGEVVVMDRERVRMLDSGVKPQKQALCIFEFVYIARPDSVIDGVSVEMSRQEAGRCLARADHDEDDTALRGDVVLGVPDSGLSAALGYAYESGIPYCTGLIKNRYIGRTFIQSSQTKRAKAVKLKLNALRTVVEGKRVIMVDDSIVRGTTLDHIVAILRLAGAKEVHLRIASPPYLHPCYFGTDIPNREVLIANRMTLEQIREYANLDSLKFLKLSDLDTITKGLQVGYCNACFTGQYPVPIR